MAIYKTMDDGPLSEISVHRVAVKRKRAEGNAAIIEATHGEGAEQRKANPVEEPLPLTFKWIARLPQDVRPLNLLRQYPRVANNLALAWRDRKAFRTCLYDLLADTRGGRRGFPQAVLQDILALRQYFEQIDAIPPQGE